MTQLSALSRQFLKVRYAGEFPVKAAVPIAGGTLLNMNRLPVYLPDAPVSVNSLRRP